MHFADGQTIAQAMRGINKVQNERTQGWAEDTGAVIGHLEAQLLLDECLCGVSVHRPGQKGEPLVDAREVPGHELRH